MRHVPANRRSISLVVAATAVALTGVIPLASAAEDSGAGTEQPLVVAAAHQAPGAITEQAAQPAVAPEPAMRSEPSIVLATDLRPPPLAQRWRVWAEPPARTARKAVRIVRAKPRPAPAIVRMAYRSDVGPRSHGFVGVGFGF
jgi:hypothetical protein